MESTEESESPLWFIDTADCDMPEIVTVDDESKANVGKCVLVVLMWTTSVVRHQR